MNRDVWQKYALELPQPITKPVIDGSWAPLNYPLIAWYRADDVIITDGAVSQWNDKSGNGYHALQATPANRPVQVMGALGERPVLNFDGTNDFMYADFGESFAQPNTIFAVWGITGVTGDGQCLIDGSPPNNNRHYISWLNNTIFIWAGTNNINYAKTLTFSPIITTAVFNTTSSFLYENGVSKASGDIGTASTGDLHIGKGGWGNLRFLNGEIAEIIAIDGLLSTADHNLFLEYFTNRYGIAHTPIV